MKKRVLFLCSAFLLTVLMLTACSWFSSPETDDSDEESRQTVTVSTIEIEKPSSAAATVSSSPMGTQTQTLEKGNIVVEYPQVRDLGGAVQNQINQLVAADAQAYLDDKLDEEEGTGVVENSVIVRGDVMSVVCTGYITDSDGGQQMVVYTTNVDLKTGSRISTGVRENAAGIAQEILDGQLIVMESNSERKAEIEAYLEDLDEDELIELLEKCDFTDEDSEPECFSYYMAEDSDEIGIYLPVPEELGSYAILLYRG